MTAPDSGARAPAESGTPRPQQNAPIDWHDWSNAVAIVEQTRDEMAREVVDDGLLSMHLGDSAVILHGPDDDDGHFTLWDVKVRRTARIPAASPSPAGDRDNVRDDLGYDWDSGDFATEDTLADLPERGEPCGAKSAPIFPESPERSCIRPKGHLGHHMDAECWWGMGTGWSYRQEAEFVDRSLAEIARLRAQLAEARDEAFKPHASIDRLRSILRAARASVSPGRTDPKPENENG